MSLTEKGKLPLRGLALFASFQHHGLVVYDVDPSLRMLQLLACEAVR